jgi:hypothetical protein
MVAGVGDLEVMCVVVGVMHHELFPLGTNRFGQSGTRQALQHAIGCRHGKLRHSAGTPSHLSLKTQ